MQQEQQKRNSNDRGKISGKIVRAGGSLAVIICLLWCGVWEVVPIAKSDTRLRASVRRRWTVCVKIAGQRYFQDVILTTTYLDTSL
ncbi:hypothetical protein ACFX2I_041695 [Malus domestica]